ncbi:L-threonylcarbamoyladenylate synthase [Glycocaulis alkaliphilus]|uniref:L-threonylcarbamoyladenylate synthase n=1 Tax=Glycocaulis alkaliphilus TaxID=1434191 RepID=UPI000FD80E6A|nr:L-threonylcarbamoyladenylate synthase [Glycocaulis alkaliphilus]
MSDTATAPILPAHDAVSLDRAAALLDAGGLVAVPTETVYGLAADATSPAAITALYEAKGRPRFNPLIAHVDSLERALTLVYLSSAALALAKAVWPGPLTLVGRHRDTSPVCDLARAGLDTLAVRWPASPAMTGLVTRLDRPLAAPSANRSGSISPTTALHVAESLGGRIGLILDGGPCRMGLESTILADTPDGLVMLRAGALEAERIEALTGQPVQRAGAGAAINAPGMLKSHYAPQSPLRLDVTEPAADETYLAFRTWQGETAGKVLYLSLAGDLAEAATRLFACLREADALGRPIAVAPIPATGLGEAINDRLARAAAPKDN